MPKIKRVPLNVSVLPDLKERLEAESEARMLGPAFIVEKALRKLLDELSSESRDESLDR